MRAHLADTPGQINSCGNSVSQFWGQIAIGLAAQSTLRHARAR